jgi:hypothetical protein
MQLLRIGWPGIAVLKLRGQFGNSEGGELPPLEAVTKGLMKTYLIVNT